MLFRSTLNVESEDEAERALAIAELVGLWQNRRRSSAQVKRVAQRHADDFAGFRGQYFAEIFLEPAQHDRSQ